MDFSQLIQQELPRMTKTEHAVASYFDSHMQEFAFSTLEAIADSAGTSTTSVIRFCRRLGFSGYKEFQRSLQEAVRVQLDLPDKVERTIRFSVQDSLLQQVIQDGLGNVERTFQDLSPEALSGAAERISRAGRVFTYGLRESLALAHYAMTRFIPLRDRVQLLDVGYNGFWESLLDLNSRDVVIYFLFHRYTAQSRRILPLLKEQGAQVILITSPPYHALEPYADVLLPCYTETGGLKNSSMAPICLIDYLCNAVAVLDTERSMAHAKKVEDLLRTERVLGS